LIQVQERASGVGVEAVDYIRRPLIHDILAFNLLGGKKSIPSFLFIFLADFLWLLKCNFDHY
jgi:hypothetical protein